jgi:hypothetical protein
VKVKDELSSGVSYHVGLNETSERKNSRARGNAAGSACRLKSDRLYQGTVLIPRAPG